MNKKFLIFSGVVIIILAIVAIFCTQRAEEEKRQQAQNQSQQENQTVSEDDLVWYEVSELEIKFKVTSDTKEDLEYTIKEYDGFKKKNDYLKIRDVLFYSKTETDKNLTGCSLGEEYGWSCGWFQLSFVYGASSNEYMKSAMKNWCSDSNKKTVFSFINNICGHRVPDYVIANDEYREFFHSSKLIEDKNFGIYLDTMQKI